MLSEWWIHSLYQQGRVTELVAWIFWVIFSICLHELAHGWMAIRQGDDTPRRLGHMTMNPMVHMGGWSLLAFLLIGIAWGLMPTNPANYRSGRMGRVYVAAAGPAMNLIIAFITLTAAGVWAWLATDGRIDTADHVTIILITGGWLNLILAAFNLLPIPPLDGSQILSGLSWKCYQFFNSPQSQMFGLFIILALLITGLFRIVFFAIQQASVFYVAILARLLP